MLASVVMLHQRRTKAHVVYRHLKNLVGLAPNKFSLHTMGMFGMALLHPGAALL
jgi:hypothetical protein